MTDETPPTRLRRRDERDCETVVSWVDDATALYLFTGPRLCWPLNAGQLRQMEEIEGYSAWVLMDATTGTVVGHFDLTVDDHIARLGRVIVAPDRRGQGLSHVLIDNVIELAKRLDAWQLALSVIAGNEPAIRTYARAGFRPTSSSDRPEVRTMTLHLSATDVGE